VPELLSLLLVSALGILLATAALGLAGLVMGTLRGPTMAAPAPGAGSVGDAGRAPIGRSWTFGGIVVGLALLSAAVVTRAILAGHAPWASLHGFSVAFAAMLLAAYVLLARSHTIDGLAPFAALLGAALIGIALGLDGSVDPLVPALQQPLLLTVHVGTAAAAYAVAGVAFLAAAAELGQRAAADRLVGLPSADTLRAVGHRAVVVAFPILTVAIVLGSVWANLAWRAYWSNDPKELAAAATWLVFGAYLHVAGRRDRWAVLAPWLIVLGFAGVLFTYIGAGLFIVGEHSYGLS
jgi:ABC-type transport system involved in cytochrome c biogenesis permease subunit